MNQTELNNLVEALRPLGAQMVDLIPTGATVMLTYEVASALIIPGQRPQSITLIVSKPAAQLQAQYKYTQGSTNGGQ